MRAPSFQFASLLLAGFLCGCAPSQSSRPALSESPAIIIRQYPDYPMPGRDSDFPGGLVVALWRDGRMIRPTRPDAVGKSYVEGFVSVAQREEFFTFLSTSAALRVPEGGGVPVDSASESIIVRRDGKMSRWARALPDTQSAWREVELRLAGLPLQESRSMEWDAVRSASWYE
jgi:hypothetical protein